MVKIVISGPPGSGKTTQAKKLAEKFNLKYFSAGSIFRKLASDRGLTLAELSLLALKDPRIDLEIDRLTMETVLNEDDIVVDGHLAAWIVAELVDLRVLITAPLPLRIARIAGRDGVSLEKALSETLAREYSQRRRFLEFYGIDITDTGIFDIVINTKRIGPDEAFEIISRLVSRYLSEKEGLAQ